MNVPFLDGIFKLFPNLKTVQTKIGDITLIKVVVNKPTTLIDKRTLVVNPSQLPEKQKKALLDSLYPSLEGGMDILEDEFYSKTILIESEVTDKKNASELDKLLKIIPTADIPILKSAVYLKSLFDQGKEVNWIKEGIRSRYGTRGSNICNLYSAGYFSTIIFPVYEAMLKRTTFSLDLFHKVYNDIVSESPFAVFIPRGMSDNSTENAINEKIAQAKEYGISRINIHGIGEENARKIQEAVGVLKKKMKIETTISLVDAVIKVEILFPNEEKHT